MTWWVAVIGIAAFIALMLGAIWFFDFMSNMSGH